MATSTRQRIDRTMGQRRNMNGAGRGGRLVANRQNTKSMTQLGNRDQRRYDIRVAVAAMNGEHVDG